MKTNTLIKYHVLAVKEIELIAECERMISDNEKMLKGKEQGKYWQWTTTELNNNIKRYNFIKKRLNTWYLQTLNKIMYFSN